MWIEEGGRDAAYVRQDEMERFSTTNYGKSATESAIDACGRVALSGAGNRKLASLYRAKRYCDRPHICVVRMAKIRGRE